MSYEVLARKWRPRSFDELIGQEHVRRALVNALDRGQLHHAYLFTGTRGVGKTTIARILAKSLNCETHGVTSAPCGQCATCLEVDGGRFIDLIEVDAASRTRVDETRELLENVPYAPTRGRYKVYLIDEVHMFSGHSFNALLKTLEEPPEHVKFLLATTDPQKVPVTILSRCLQFNLKLIPIPLIESHLGHIVASESIPADDGALAQIARSATGSMRDALSLLDQAVAYGQGEVRQADVESMLGTLSQERLFRLGEALAEADGAALLAEVEGLASAATDLEPVLVELQTLLHQIAIAQTVPQALAPGALDPERVRALADRLSPATVQLYHQIATLGRRDMAWAPDPRGGLEMTLLRMLAFRPAEAGDGADPAAGEAPDRAPVAGAGITVAPGSTSAPRGARSATLAEAATEPAQASPSAPASPQRQEQSEVPTATGAAGTPAAATPTSVSSEASMPAPEAPAQARGASAAAAAAAENRPAGAGELDWPTAVAHMKLRGLAGELATNTALVDFDGDRVRLGLAPEHAHLGGERYRARLAAALSEYLNTEIRLELVSEVPSGMPTPAELEQQASEERLQAAREHIHNDPVVQAIEERFDGAVDNGSVHPTGPEQGAN